jgi:hypothetical protein
MKIILLSGIFCLVFAQNILAEKTITCKVTIVYGETRCTFSRVTIGQNETVTIRTDPVDLSVNTITEVVFDGSSIYSVPSEIFTKFPNTKQFYASRQLINEVYTNTFHSGKKLELIGLGDNLLTFLDANTFKGLLGLKQIYLDNNNLHALHPRMFAHLAKLNRLHLGDNICVNKNFYPVTSLALIEKELAACASDYCDSGNGSIDGNALEVISEKFASLQTKLEEREKKVDQELEQVSELFAHVYQGNKENTAEIKKINEKVDKIVEILTSK